MASQLRHFQKFGVAAPTKTFRSAGLHVPQLAMRPATLKSRSAAAPKAADSRSSAPVEPCSLNSGASLPEDGKHGQLADWLGRSAGGASVLAVGGGLLGSGFDLSGPTSILGTLAVLAAVVGVHELGHFLAARLQRIHVTKFAIGFGPPLLRYQGAEVEYSLRAFPLGGFVAFPDDDPDSPFPEDDPDLLRNRPVLDRALVTCAGVAANVVFAYTICVAQAATVGVMDPVFLPGVKLGPVMANTVAERAGLKQGDLLLQVGDLKVAPDPGMVGAVVDKIQHSPKQALAVEVEREGKKVQLSVTPAEMPDGTGRLGVSLAPNMRVETLHASGAPEALALGAKDFKYLLGTVVNGLSQLVGNFQQTASQISGPVAIVAIGSEVARADSSGLFRFAAIINLNLAVINILPLPALDGGYLALQLLETVRRGRKLDLELERGILTSGFLLLSSLGIFLIVKDVVKLSSPFFSSLL